MRGSTGQGPASKLLNGHWWIFTSEELWAGPPLHSELCVFFWLHRCLCTELEAENPPEEERLQALITNPDMTPSPLLHWWDGSKMLQTAFERKLCTGLEQQEEGPQAIEVTWSQEVTLSAWILTSCVLLRPTPNDSNDIGYLV